MVHLLFYHLLLDSIPGILNFLLKCSDERLSHGIWSLLRLSFRCHAHIFTHHGSTANFLQKLNVLRLILWIKLRIYFTGFLVVISLVPVTNVTDLTISMTQGVLFKVIAGLGRCLFEFRWVWKTCNIFVLEFGRAWIHVELLLVNEVSCPGSVVQAGSK